MRALLLSLLALGVVHAYQFEMRAHTRRCFREDIPLSTAARLTYKVAQGPGDMAVSVRVEDATGRLLHRKTGADHGVFSFVAPDRAPGRPSWAREDVGEEYYVNDAGDDRAAYSFCFEHARGLHMPKISGGVVSRRVLFDVRFGAESKTEEDYDLLAKEKHLSSTEELFKAVEERVADVVKRIDEMRLRETRMSRLNKRTQRSVLFYSLFACAVIAGAAAAASWASIRQLRKAKLG